MSRAPLADPTEAQPRQIRTRRLLDFRVPVAVIGTGTVGKALLGQLRRRQDLAGASPWPLQLAAVANSRSMRFDPQLLDGCDWVNGVLEGEATELGRFVRRVARDATVAPVIVDLTASSEVAKLHAGWLRSGLRVVTANKLALAGRQSDYDALQAAATGGRYGYETTVGAALPVIQTVRDLWLTGDCVTRIQGILSGTLSFLFKEYDGRRPFSSLVREARVHGLTEPDPRADLTGQDVARKLLILAREAGFALEPEDIKVESLVPALLAERSASEVAANLTLLDAPLQARLEEAQRGGQVLRYTAVLEASGRARVGLQAVAPGHNLGTVGYAENVIEITTQRYQLTPLTIRGPGAGAELTAAGVLADILKLPDTAHRPGTHGVLFHPHIVDSAG